MPLIVNRDPNDSMAYERGSELNKTLHLGQNKNSVVANSSHKKRLMNIEKLENMRIKTSPAMPRKKNSKKAKIDNAEFVSVTGYAGLKQHDYPRIGAHKESTTAENAGATTMTPQNGGTFSKK